jgi:prolyl-tRNA synthetase
MKYRDLNIQTQREAPNNARTQGFAFLVRAGYLTRDGKPTTLGEYTLSHLKKFDQLHPFFSYLDTVSSYNETFFPIQSGSIEIIFCSTCRYTERLEFARSAKSALPQEEQLPLEKVPTPDCNTIESLANFLGIPKEKTAKALMYTRVSDGKFIFVVVRGNMQLSEAKLKNHVGDVRTATMEEIQRAGAIPGYASPIGLKEALIVVDDLIPISNNLVAGANEAGYHLKNTNYRRDYSAEIVVDLIQAKATDACLHCGNPLSILSADLLATHGEYNFEHLLLAIAEDNHDDKGLTFHYPPTPFPVYLMHIPGKQMDTRAKAEEVYNTLQNTGIPTLFDDRNERAGVKFNDADLIGCPVRITVGEKNLMEGKVEVKKRNRTDIQLVSLDELVPFLKR